MPFRPAIPVFEIVRLLHDLRVLGSLNVRRSGTGPGKQKRRSADMDATARSRDRNELRHQSLKISIPIISLRDRFGTLKILCHRYHIKILKALSQENPFRILKVPSRIPNGILCLK